MNLAPGALGQPVKWAAGHSVTFSLGFAIAGFLV
jgi:hypothetical protein